MNSQAELDRLEEETNGDILLENIGNLDFEQQTVIGAIGESKTDQTRIIFNPVLEKEEIIVKWYETENEIHPTSMPVQNYLFVSIEKTSKDIVFKNSDN